MGLCFRQRQQELKEARLKGESEISPGAKVIATMPPMAKGLMAGKQIEKFLADALSEDLLMLKATKSIERKEQIKRDILIPKYREQVLALIKANKKHELISYYMIWCFDAGEIPEGLEIAEYCLQNEIKMPERFKSNVAFFVSNNLLDWGKAEFAAARSFEPYISDLLAKIEAENWDIDDACKAGFYTLLGRAELKAENYQEAVTKLVRAAELGGKVKTDLELAKKKLAKQPTEIDGSGCDPALTGDDVSIEQIMGSELTSENSADASSNTE